MALMLPKHGRNIRSSIDPMFGSIIDSLTLSQPDTPIACPVVLTKHAANHTSTLCNDESNRSADTLPAEVEFSVLQLIGSKSIALALDILCRSLKTLRSCGVSANSAATIVRTLILLASAKARIRYRNHRTTHRGADLIEHTALTQSSASVLIATAAAALAVWAPQRPPLLTSPSLPATWTLRHVCNRIDATSVRQSLPSTTPSRRQSPLTVRVAHLLVCIAAACGDTAAYARLQSASHSPPARAPDWNMMGFIASACFKLRARLPSRPCAVCGGDRGRGLPPQPSRSQAEAVSDGVLLGLRTSPSLRNRLVAAIVDEVISIAQQLVNESLRFRAAAAWATAPFRKGDIPAAAANGERHSESGSPLVSAVPAMTHLRHCCLPVLTVLVALLDVLAACPECSCSPRPRRATADDGAARRCCQILACEVHEPPSASIIMNRLDALLASCGGIFHASAVIKRVFFVAHSAWSGSSVAMLRGVGQCSTPLGVSAAPLGVALADIVGFSSQLPDYVDSQVAATYRHLALAITRPRSVAQLTTRVAPLAIHLSLLRYTLLFCHHTFPSELLRSLEAATPSSLKASNAAVFLRGVLDRSGVTKELPSGFPVQLFLHLRTDQVASKGVSSATLLYSLPSMEASAHSAHLDALEEVFGGTCLADFNALSSILLSLHRILWHTSHHGRRVWLHNAVATRQYSLLRFQLRAIAEKALSVVTRSILQPAFAAFAEDFAGAISADAALNDSSSQSLLCGDKVSLHADRYTIFLNLVQAVDRLRVQVQAACAVLSGSFGPVLDVGSVITGWSRSIQRLRTEPRAAWRREVVILLDKSCEEGFIGHVEGSNVQRTFLGLQNDLSAKANEFVRTVFASAEKTSVSFPTRCAASPSRVEVDTSGSGFSPPPGIRLHEPTLECSVAWPPRASAFEFPAPTPPKVQAISGDLAGLPKHITEQVRELQLTIALAVNDLCQESN